jgi:RsiW-degrading membrane proteinase PrsW (M82 family)
MLNDYRFSHDPVENVVGLGFIGMILLLVAAGFIKVILLFKGAVLRGDFLEAAAWALLIGIPWIGFWLFNRTR